MNQTKFLLPTSSQISGGDKLVRLTVRPTKGIFGILAELSIVEANNTE